MKFSLQGSFSRMKGRLMPTPQKLRTSELPKFRQIMEAPPITVNHDPIFGDHLVIRQIKK